VIHNPDLPVVVPAPDEETFAVVSINGFQYKVVKDDIVLANYLEGYDINQQIVFDAVLLVGSKQFTLVGRPFVKSAKVYATVEEQTETDKMVIFKKKRRKTYQKTMHFRHMITVLRVNKIEVEVDDALKAKAVALN
jgi:large subunit ribosomal protein L21